MNRIINHLPPSIIEPPPELQAALPRSDSLELVESEMLRLCDHNYAEGYGEGYCCGFVQATALLTAVLTLIALWRAS